MMPRDDVLIIGAGPAGTSAALAFAGSGLRVRLVDAGDRAPTLPPEAAFLEQRLASPTQWRWQVGDDLSGLRSDGGSSPKLRVPGLQPVFAGFAEANRIVAEQDFQVVGALSAGGLSNAWGCGVAAFDAAELAPLGAAEREALDAGYARAAARMGLSGASDDGLRDALGVDAWSAPAIALDPLFEHLWRKRARVPDGFSLGRARVAVLGDGQARDGRKACDRLGLCLWGCPRRATWSAAMDLEAVRRAGVAVDAGCLVQGITADSGGWRVEMLTAGAARTLHARKLLLAAGTLASTRLALAALPSPPAQVRLLSNPMAAFLALVPARLGAAAADGFGLAQLSYLASTAAGVQGFGNLFPTTGLPVSEFAAYLPIGRRAGLPLLRALLPACAVGNLFLPGALSDHRAWLGADGALHVAGGSADTLEATRGELRLRVTEGLGELGARILPGSFVPGKPGADLHYAGSLAMRASPAVHEADLHGEIAGLPGVYAVDGAALPSLPAKAHTLTIMANADRIARGLVERLAAEANVQ